MERILHFNARKGRYEEKIQMVNPSGSKSYLSAEEAGNLLLRRNLEKVVKELKAKL